LADPRFGGGRSPPYDTQGGLYLLGIACFSLAGLAYFYAGVQFYPYVLLLVIAGVVFIILGNVCDHRHMRSSFK